MDMLDVISELSSDGQAAKRQARIDAAARAALTGLLVATANDAISDTRAARQAYDIAEAMEIERARRIK